RTATNTPLPPIKAGPHPDAIAITPDGKTAYVANDVHAGTVTPIPTATNTPLPPIKTGHDTAAIAITPDATTAYTVNNAADPHARAAPPPRPRDPTPARPPPRAGTNQNRPPHCHLRVHPRRDDRLRPHPPAGRGAPVPDRHQQSPAADQNRPQPQRHRDHPG